MMEREISRRHSPQEYTAIAASISLPRVNRYALPIAPAVRREGAVSIATEGA
jgi:hypothetical protein